VEEVNSQAKLFFEGFEFAGEYQERYKKTNYFWHAQPNFAARLDSRNHLQQTVQSKRK
jgi:hypothetical protein